ncbi:MAG: DUF370 domain-containing protein [Nitrospirae bacterium]|nr:DUF370 domain-containing protein [Nitrospirota bacterium]
MDFKLVNIGFGNVVVASRVVSIVSPSSAPMKRLKDEAKKMGRLIDASQGRKTRAIIITDSGHVILSAIQTETITQRFAGKSVPGPYEEEDILQREKE